VSNRAPDGRPKRRSNPALKRLDSWSGSVVLGALSLVDRLRRARVPQVKPEQVQRILVIKLCCMGDGLLAVPAVRAVARHFPNASLTCLCTSRNREVFEGLPYFEEVIALGVSGTGGLREIILGAAPGLLRLMRDLRRRRFEIVLDLDLYFRATPAIGYLTGAPVRAGFQTEGAPGRERLFTHRVLRLRDRHEVECFLDLVAALGVPRVEDHLEFATDSASESTADRLLAEGGIGADTSFAVLVPGSSKNWPEKQWPAESFAAVGDALTQEYGLAIVLVGAAFERQLCERVAAAMRAPALSLAGRTTIKQTGHVLRRARLTVSNDTGPMHLSAAVGTPVVALFGPTDERKWRPWGDQHVVVADRSGCGPCYYLSEMPVCEHRDCLRRIPVDAVLSACRQVLSALEEAPG
jgi:heptosyltransferase-1